MKKRKTIKRTYSKRKSNSQQKCKMNLREKEFLAVGIFLFFVFAFMLTAVNTSQDSNYVKVTGHDINEENNKINQINDIEIDFSGLGDFLTNVIDPTKANATVIKWIVLFSFVLGLWGVLHFLKWENPFFMILAVPIAFAMTYLLDKTQILAGIIPYSAMGLAIILGAPFIAIFLGSMKLLEGKRSVTKTVAQLMAWYFYLACLIYFLVIGFLNKNTFSKISLLIICVGIIFSIIIIIKNKPWREWLANIEREGTKKAIEDIQHALGTEEKAKSENVKQHLGGAWYNRK